MSFQISDYYELLALHKIMLEAKFHLDPDDRDIADSPIAASIACRLVEALKLAEHSRGQPQGADNWDRWRIVDQKSRFWKNSVRFAKHHEPWPSLSDDQRRELVRVLLSPFDLTDDTFAEFVRQVGDSPDP